MRSRKGLTERREKTAWRQMRRCGALAASRRSGILLRTSALTTVALALSGMAAHAQDAGLWQPQVRAIIGANSNSGFTALEGFLPIKQNLESVLFLDVRSKYDFDNGFGQDVGLGVRRIVNPDLMVGGYAYLNVQNDDSHQFVGTTLGLEAITSKYDAHVNVYLPISKDRGSNGIDSTLSLVGNQLLEEISTIDHRTYAAWGIEGEVGVQAPIDLPENQSLRFDVGAYHFADPDGDDHSITGAKAGIEYTIGDVIGKGTSLTFTGEVRNDNRDDTQFAGSVRLTVPFNVPGKGGGSADDDPEPVSTVSPGLRKRLNERVRGDIGVRLEHQDRVSDTTTRVAINAATNTAFGNFFFADGGNSLGLGTIGDPTTLDDAVTKAGGNGFIVALGGSGNITTGGVNLAAGQTVIGGGGGVQAKLANGSIGTYNFGGSNGTIQGTNAANPVITLASNNTLSNLTITGGADGIFGNNAAGTRLTDVTVTSAGGNGADFTGNSTSVTASNFTATGNGLDGLHIEDNGTYNFTGTTTLNGNADDGLDITGQGTYTFATVNAQNNSDRGITVQGTSSGGSFTITGGTISGNGGTAVFIDPITAHVVLDSITQSGGVSGVILDQVSGSFTVNGATTISNTTGPAIAITASPASIRFGDINITNPGADGLSFTGVNAAVVAGNIVISGLGAGSGLDFFGSQTNFTAQSLNLTGTGAAGSIGLDLANTTGDASIIITSGGSISGVDTGVRLGISGSLANSANAEFTFGGGSIAGITASLDARGLNQTLGHYAFGSTTFSGPQLFEQQNVIFVGASATGAGDGSSLLDLASIATADANTDGTAIFVLVNRGTSIDAAGGFTLSDGQTLASFGNGRTFSLGGVPVNVTGDNIQHDQVVSDAGGAATLTNSGAGDVVTAGSGSALLDFNISGGAAAGIQATGIAGLTVQGVSVSNAALGLVLNSVTGTISVDDLTIQNPSQFGIELVNTGATVNFTGNMTVTNATGAALLANNFDGTAAFDDLDISGGGGGVAILNGSDGTLTFGAASSITNTGSESFGIGSSSANVTYNGTINQTGTGSAVKISALTGGSATFGGKITANITGPEAINLSGNTGSTINFTGGLDLTTDGGFGFSAVNGGTLNVTGTNTIATGAGVTEKGLQLSGLTIGASGVNFASVTVDGSGGIVPTGIVIVNTSGGAIIFGGVDISRVNGDAVRLTNVANNVTFGGTTKIDTVVAGGPGFVVENSAGTVSVNNLVTTNVSGADVSLANNTGTIGIGGTVTNSGTGDGVVISGGSAAITVSANISSSATAPGTAVKVNGTTGGSVAFTGNVTSTGTGNLFAIGTTTAPTGGAITFAAGKTLTATGGGGAVIGGLAGNATFNDMALLSITNATGNGLSVSNVASGAIAGFSSVTISGAGGNSIEIANNAGQVTFSGATTVTMGSAANTAGIDLSGTNDRVAFGTTSVSNVGADQTGIDFSDSSTTADFGLTTITSTGDLTSRGIDLSSTTGNKTISFERGSSISGTGVGVELSSGGTTATSANANFTFGDGTSADGRQSSITAAAGGYTVNTIGLDPTLGNYDFDDVAFTGSAHLASAVGGVIMVSQNGGVIAAGTNGLSADVTTVSVAAADAMVGTQTFAFVGTIDLSSTPFTLDSGQSIDGFGNGNSILTSGTVQPINVQGNLGATGGNVTGDEGVVTGTGDLMHLLGSNQVKNTAFDFSGASGSVFLIDQNAAGFSNAGGIFIDGVTISNVAAGQTAFKVDGLTTNLSITNNNIDVAGALLNADGGNGNITFTRGNLPNSGPAGTLTGGGISIANRTGGLVNFTDKVMVNGNGVSLTNNTGATVTFANVDITTSGTAAFSATGGGTVNVNTGTINATDAQAAALDGIAANTNFASTTASFSAGNGIDLQNVSGTAAFGTGTLTNTGAGTSFNVGSVTDQSGGNATISYEGNIASNGTGAAVSIRELTGGSVTLSGNLTDANAAAGGNIVVAGIDNGTAATVTFSGATKQISSGATDAVSLASNPNGTVNFTNGGLGVTTTRGAGFTAGAGTISVTGAGNTITSTTGTALDLANATVGAGGVTFDSISVDGAATGVALNNVSGGTIGLGEANLQNISSRGVDISGTLGASVTATSINVGLNAANAVGLDLNGASLGASNITANDFDVDGGSFAGTIGVDLAGTTGTGTIQLGDTVNNNPAGQISTIANVGYGVQFSSATNAKLVFGDGQGPAESSIATTGGQVIHATDTLPTNGDYNFNDVNFTGDTSNLASIHVYYVDLDGNLSGTGDGSLANPGSLAQAQASTANVIVLIDKNANGSQETLDLSGGTFQLDDGQVLLAFKSGDAAIDVSQLGVSAGGGASGVFHFTTVQNSTIVDAPVGIDTLRPVLQSNNATSVINLATSGTGIFTGGVENLIIRNTGNGDGIFVNATSASSFFLRNNDIAAGGNALDFSTTGASANTLLLSIDDNTLQSTGTALAASFAGQNISATSNSIAIRSFSGNTVTGGTGGGIAFSNVTFDSTGAGGTVSVGTLDVGTTGARVQGDGLAFTNTSGTLDLGTFIVANNGGTGVMVDTKGANTSFTLNSSGGSVDTTNGTAFNLDPLTVNMTVASVTATGGASGIIFDGVAGTFTVTGATTVTGTSGAGISGINTNTGTFNFNMVTVNNTSTVGDGIGWASGTLNIGGLANIDTASGVGVSQTGGTTGFSGGITVDTTSGTGILGVAGTMNISATGGSETVNATNGQAISLFSVAANIALDSTSSGGGTFNVGLSNVTGSVNLGSGALSGALGSAFNVSGGTADISYSGSIAKTTSGNVVAISGRTAGTTTLSGNLSATGGADNGILVSGNSGGTVNFSGTSKTLSTGANAAVSLTGNAGSTVNFSNGGLAITTNSGTGFNTSGGGTFSVATGANANTISTGTGVAVSMNAAVIAAGGVNFASTSNGSGGTSGVILTNVTGSGTINLGAGALVGGSAAAVSISGGSANLIYSGNVTQATSGQALASVAGGHSGTVTFNTGTLSATNGTGLQFDNADGAYNFNGTTTLNGGDAGVDILNGSGGNFSFGAGTSISNPTGVGFNVNGGAGTITYAGSISKNNTNNVLSIQNRTGGTTTLSGSITATGGLANGILVNANSGGTINFSGGTKILSTGANTAVNLTGNTGATINFTGGGLDIDTTSGAGFNATGGGTVTVTAGASPNTIDSTTGTALNVVNTTIGASGLTFRSIWSNGAANGIVLNNTGTSGGLTVTGDGGGTNNGSGGTIQNSTGDGVSLTNTQDVHLAYMNLTNNLGDGIGGSGINGFVLNRLNISGNGNDAATDESGINITQLTGTASNGAHATSISNSVISNNNEFEIQISNSSGTLTNLVLNNNTISSNGQPINGNATSPHGNLVNFLGLGTSVMGITVTGGSFTGDWNPASPPATITGTGLFANSGGTSMTVNVSGATFTNNNAGIDVSTDPASTSLTFDIENNTFIGQRSTAINHFDNGNAPFTRTVNGTIKNNVIGNNAVTNSGSSVGTGIQIQNEGAVNGKYLIDGNQIYQIATGNGISVNVGLGGQATGGGETDLTITNNIFDHINGSRAIAVQDNQVTDIASPPGAGPFPTIWLNLQGNSFSNIAGQAGNGQYVRLKQSYGVFKVTQSAATVGANAGELDDANGINDPTKFSTSSTSGSIQYGQGAAPLPTTNPLP
ncbi:conserved exported hypothetical protein [Mesorhizobium plurifarium]|uniref:Inverse autotransporter beta-domain domain-containing protein n=1 Tax=Mesorhizobium plurifarium TaxID=69974 RepID=A0A090G2U0_MESPL|nr:conserved exported hypothetical protein [Mesorhizobium plurifarium]